MLSRVMSTQLTQPVPKDLRAQMIRRLETAPEDVVLMVHNVLLQIEKESLWQKIQKNASEEAQEGKSVIAPEGLKSCVR